MAAITFAIDWTVVLDGVSGARQAWSNVMSVEPAPSSEAEVDLALVTEARGGSDAAFAELIKRHKGRIFAMASRFARDAHEREDLCQEIFLQAYRKLGEFRGEAPFGHWLARLAVRKCYDLLRRSRRERETHVSLDAVPVSPPDDSSNRARQAQEAREVLGRALATLPPDDRLVITLLELEDRSVREIAALAGWSETNVRTRAYRARSALKKILEQQNGLYP